MATKKTSDQGAAAGLISFTLNEDDSAEYRQDAASPEGDLAGLWEILGQEMGFDPQTVQELLVPEDDQPISFKAIPAPISQDGVDHEKIVAEELSDMEQKAGDFELDLGTMVGDLQAGLLEVIQRMQKPFAAHSQAEKRDLAAKLEHISKTVARRATDLVASGGLQSTKAVLEKIAIGDKVIITLKLAAMPEDEMAEAVTRLYHLQRKSVTITSADADQLMGRRRDLVEPDEMDLPFDSGSDAPKTEDDHPDDDSDLAGDD